MKEKIICIVTPVDKTYYRATPVAKEFLDKEHNVVHTTGTIPDGDMEEYNVSSVTLKTLRKGKLHGKLEIINLTNNTPTLTEEYDKGKLLNTLQTSTLSHPSLEKSAPPAISGTILKSNNGTHSFYLNGQEIAEETVSSGMTVELLGNIPDGEVKELDENNKVKAIVHYKNNKMHGTLTRYDDDGEVLSREEYVAGILQGPAEYFSYLNNDLLYTKCTYKNALLEGERTVIQKDGTLRERSSYSHGKLQGERTSFYPNGVAEIKENYKDGQLNGERTLFFPSGETWYKENFSNNLLEGTRTAYYPKGKIYMEEFYSEGLLNGPRKVYDQNGNLLTSEEYHWGTLLHNTERMEQ